MSKGPDRDVKKWDRWRGLVDRQSRSGQSVRAFCREHGLGESAFYFWRRQLASETRTPDALRRSSRRTGRGGSREVASVWFLVIFVNRYNITTTLKSYDRYPSRSASPRVVLEIQ